MVRSVAGLGVFGHGDVTCFVAAMEHCHEQILIALAEGADRSPDGSAAEILSTMGDTYADLIADHELLSLPVHAQSATDVPQIREALRRGYASVVEYVKQPSGGSDSPVRGSSPTAGSAI